MKKILGIIILFVIAITLVIIFSKDNSYIKTSELYINEILPSNHISYKNKDLEYLDYIELYNNYNYDINLEGFHLTDDIFNKYKWTFPNKVIKKKDYLIIYASGKNKCDLECHTNFKLNKEGEIITLIDKTGNIISQVKYNNLPSDVSLSFSNNKYIITKPTPNLKNSSEELKSDDINKYKIVINEYMSHNKNIYASNGIAYDYIELYNMGEDINLYGLGLTDDSKKLNKFIFPDLLFKKNSYLVIYLTNDKIENEISTNFKLSDNDDYIILSKDDKIIDKVKVVKLLDNISYGRKDDKWLYFLTPTMNYENNTYGVEKLGDLNGST